MAHSQVRPKFALAVVLFLAVLACLATVAGGVRAQDAGEIQLQKVVDGLASPSSSRTLATAAAACSWSSGRAPFASSRMAS